MVEFPDWATWYKKPEYVDVKQYGAELNEKASASSPRSSSETERSRKKTDIPTRLSLENIMKNKTCSPMSLYDFFMYLKYIERSAENLEFYVWYKNYEQGRLTAFPEAPRTLTPVSGESDSDFSKDPETGTADHDMPEPGNDIEMNEAELFARMASFVQPGSGCGNGACSPSQKGGALSPFYKRPFSLVKKLENDAACEAPELSKTETEMQTAQHAELEMIKNLFLVPGSPKELNLPAPMRKKVLDSIENGEINPQIIKPAADHCWLLLKSCSHRNFVRLGVSNGTFETLCVATTLGIVLTIMGFVSMILLAFVSPGFRQASRWRGLGIWPMWATGLGLILSGLRGSCFFLLLFSRRQPLPWERFDEDRPQIGKKKRNPVVKLLSKLMIFDRKMKVKDDDLRRLQHKVVTQSLLGGATFATAFVILFLCIPMWKPL